MLHATHEGTLLIHHEPPSIPRLDVNFTLYIVLHSELFTSGKFEQILAIASLTCNCVSENPDVSINVFARLVEETEKGRNDMLDCNGLWVCRFNVSKHLDIHLLDMVRTESLEAVLKLPYGVYLLALRILIKLEHKKFERLKQCDTIE